jgi:hypothetical protein
MGTKYSEYDVSEYTPDIHLIDEAHQAEVITDDTGHSPKQQARKAIERYFDRRRLRKDLSFFS